MTLHARVHGRAPRAHRYTYMSINGRVFHRRRWMCVAGVCVHWTIKCIQVASPPFNSAHDIIVFQRLCANITHFSPEYVQMACRMAPFLVNERWTPKACVFPFLSRFDRFSFRTTVWCRWLSAQQKPIYSWKVYARTAFFFFEFQA